MTIPPFTRGNELPPTYFLLYPVRQELPYPSPVTRVEGQGFIIQPLCPVGPFAPQMALPALGTHKLAATCDMETALACFVGLKLGHR